MMTGPASIKQIICDYLKVDLGQRIPKMRNAWNLSSEELPMPTVFWTFAPPSLNFQQAQLPVCYTVIISSPGVTRIGYDNVSLDPTYRVKYSARTYVWVKCEANEMDDNYTVATRTRDNLMTVIRSSILDDQCFNNHINGGAVKFDESTVYEEYSDLVPVKGERILSGGFIAYELTIDEVLTRDTIGVVQDIQILPRFLSEDDLGV